MRLSTVLETITHVALIAVSAFILWRLWVPMDRSSPDAGSTVQVDSSEVLSSWRPSDRRVFLFVSPVCSYCNRSMGFYASLGHVVDSMQQSGVPVSLAAVVNSSVSPRLERHTLRDSSVTVDSLLVLSSQSFDPVGVSGVPTVAVESQGKKSLSVWRGLQDSTGKQEILAAVRALGAQQ